MRTYSSLGLFHARWDQKPVGTADFTVEDDRQALGPVMERLIDDAQYANAAFAPDDATAKDE